LANSTITIAVNATSQTVIGGSRSCCRVTAALTRAPDASANRNASLTNVTIDEPVASLR
jgi:hypothetical protein